MQKIKRKISTSDYDFNDIVTSCLRGSLTKETDIEMTTKALSVVMRLFPALSNKSKHVIFEDIHDYLEKPKMWGIKEEFYSLVTEFYEKIQAPQANTISYVNIEVESEDFGLICYEAVKYAVGRETYMPSVVCGFVTPYINLIDRQYLIAIKDFLDSTSYFGDPLIDEPIWSVFRKVVDKAVGNA